MVMKSVLVIVLACIVSACGALPKSSYITLPLLQAWHEGKVVLYITTDVSDQAVAKAENANYAPRLRDAVPNYPKPPQQKTVLERVYAFPKGEQSKNVFASAPEPLGYLSENRQYSPLWLMYVVVWNDPNQAQELTSEEAIFVAEDQGLVTIERTDIVLNCPVIPFHPDTQ
ncbi:hypothetical protein [Marinomonas sp. IMCC 4694]|uniref:DUF7482 domain-containing protein n=1 Tax=Marinomonas sp. IMCC 4694 TaxID=2605432 RepID=UPI0011E70BBD|nr:hypothetical protein [Marinomonas sp. IMCC 4694]TYL46668.1 hypothetical protein FXV75_01205 [Marinomonas sp. IMCC 4694]